MDLSFEQLEAELVDLPRHIRARLAETLVASLREELDVEDAWIEESERRYADYLAGKVQPIPVEQAMAELRARLRQEPSNEES